MPVSIQFTGDPLVHLYYKINYNITKIVREKFINIETLVVRRIDTVKSNYCK